MKLRSLLLAALCTFAGLVFAEESDDGFRSIFDGKSLEGWACVEPDLFVIEDGTIVATNTEENPIKNNHFLVWQGGAPGDFELKLKFKIEGPPRANSGIQFRGTSGADGHVIGYQADIDRAGRWVGTLYDEHTGRKVLAKRGEKTTIAADGTRETNSLGDADALKGRIDFEGWNEYHISAIGNHIVLKINGEVMSEVIDDEAGESDDAGMLALQIHKGPPMTIRFKDIRLKEYENSASKMKPIFNGKDLSGWKAPENNIWWLADDGILKVRSGPDKKGSILWTENEYEDFEVSCEFRFGEGIIDSGIHVRNMDQIQIGISGSLKRDMTASPYIPKKGYPVEAEGVAKLLKADDWNQLKVVVRGKNYTTFLNGKKVMTYDSESAIEKGPVGIQLHGNRDMSMDYRAIKLREL